MSYGAPGPNGFNTYVVEVAKPGVAAFTCVLEASGLMATPEALDTMVQEFIDFVDGSTVFELGAAQRQTPYSSMITPTP